METEAGTPTVFRSEFTHRPTKINWAEAREYYLNNSDVTIHMVADKFNVSYKTAAIWAAREKWFKKRGDTVAEQNLEIAKKRKEESDGQVNERHIEAYRQMQQFIKTNMAIAQSYIREKYVDAEKKGSAVGKKEQYSAQNIKYMMEAWKIAIDGERIGLGIATDSPKKSEKDIKVSGQLNNYNRSQIEALFIAGSELAKDTKLYDVTDDGHSGTRVPDGNADNRAGS